MGRFATTGHIQLRDGEVVSNKDLCSFIRHIQSFLPKPEPPRPLAPLLKRSLRTLPDREDELYSRPLVGAVRNMGSRRGRGGGRPRGGGRAGVRRFRRVRNERREGPRYHPVARVDRDISRFLQPTWLFKRRPGVASSRYTGKEVSLLGQAAARLGRSLDTSGLRWERLQGLELEPREAQLVELYREQEASLGSAGEAVAVVVARPAVQRTYSRRGRGQVKESGSRSQTPAVTEPPPPAAVEGGGASLPPPSGASLLPPSRASLLGLRGLLLRSQHLRTAAGDTGTLTSGGRLAPSQAMAEERLVKRVAQMFFWPAKMSTIAPPKQVKLFEESSEEEEESADVDAEATDNIVTVLESSASKEAEPRMGRGLHGVFRQRDPHNGAMEL